MNTAPHTTEPDTDGGLTAAQAAQRLAQDGPNALPRAPQRTTWRIALEVAREPMFQLLAAAVGIYLLLGERSEALVLLAFLAVIVGITLVQERRTERALIGEYRELRHDLDRSSPARLFRRPTQQKLTACPPHRSPKTQHLYCDPWQALEQ